MNKIFRMAAVAVLLLLGTWNTARADFNIGVGTDDFYVSVGKYDYYPYGVPSGYNPRVSFYDVMSDYGTWVSVNPFGRVWQPYANQQWRPYLYGHWIYTSYGQTWQGYEPWAWVGYHYGNWIWTERFGWVWMPGYDWHPGRVAWSHGYNEIGWMPSPPVGYDYCGGSIHYHGGYNQFTYNDPDYGYYDNNYNGYDRGYYGGGYGSYDSRYRQLYGTPSYTNISVNLWVFINKDHYGYDNYGDYYLRGDQTRQLFERHAVRVSSAPLERTQLERIVKKRVQEVPVDVREMQTERKSVKVVVPRGEEERIRKNAGNVVRKVIAPEFEKERHSFKSSAETERAVERIFKQPVSVTKRENERHDQPLRIENRNDEKRTSYGDDHRAFPKTEAQREQEFRRDVPAVKTPSHSEDQFRRDVPVVKSPSHSEDQFRRETSSHPRPEPRYEPPVVKKAPQPEPRWNEPKERENSWNFHRPEPDTRSTRELGTPDYRRPQPQNDPRREIMIEQHDSREVNREQYERRDPREYDRPTEVRSEREVQDVRKQSDDVRKQSDKDRDSKKDADRKEKSGKNHKDSDHDKKH